MNAIWKCISGGWSPPVQSEMQMTVNKYGCMLTSQSERMPTSPTPLLPDTSFLRVTKPRLRSKTIKKQDGRCIKTIC